MFHLLITRKWLITGIEDILPTCLTFIMFDFMACTIALYHVIHNIHKTSSSIILYLSSIALLLCNRF